jgi:MioC protein
MLLKILVGTVTNTAEYVAQAIEMDCADLADRIEVRMMDGLDIHVFDAHADEDPLFLICTSTFGAGDVPDNAYALFQSLDQHPQFLGHVRYGVLALGDQSSHGPTFCQAGKLFDERLQGLGARRVGEMYCHDSSDGSVPEVEGTAWCRAWLAQAGAA